MFDKLIVLHILQLGIRDIIVHHYFDVDAVEIFRISKENVPELLSVIDKMINDLTENSF